MADRTPRWTLEDLIDFEVALSEDEAVLPAEGVEVRKALREKDFQGDESAKRRFGLLRWLKLKERTATGARVVRSADLLGWLMFAVSFLGAVVLIKSLVVEIRGTGLRGFNIWHLLAVTVGSQWLFIIGGLIAYWLAPRFNGGLGWCREMTAKLLKRLSGRVKPEVWQRLTELKSGQRNAFAWRLARVLQLGGTGGNLGLLAGLFLVLGFSDIYFYWESSLPQFGPQSLAAVTDFLSLGLPSFDPGAEQITRSRVTAGEMDLLPQSESRWRSFFWWSVFIWGLLPRIGFWWFTKSREQAVLNSLQLQDPPHRKLWRDLTKVERSVTIQGPSDGVVLLDVGGLELDTQELRPFLLQTLRVNPERSYSVGVLDAEREKEAWAAIQRAPCGVIMLVEGWALSPKQIENLVRRIREHAGQTTVLRVLVLGDGLEAPEEDDFSQWQHFIDSLRDPHLECIAYEAKALLKADPEDVNREEIKS